MLLVPDEVDKVNVNLVLEVLMQISVEDDKIHMSAVDEVEVLMLGTVLTEDLIFSLLVDVFSDVNDVAMNREVDVEVG
eukprot:4783946-Amphidinium_carterae.1